MALLLWKKLSKSVMLLRLCDASSKTTRRSLLVSIVGKTEEERKALVEADNVGKGRTFKTDEEKERLFRIWKYIMLAEHPDPNNKLAFRNLRARSNRVDRD